MAVAYLNVGATSLVAANWSDATGFADDAELVINAGGQSIQTGLTSGSTANGISYLDITSGFSGTIGGTAGSLTVETRASLFSAANQLPRIRYGSSGGELYVTPQGGGAAPNVIHFLQNVGTGFMHVTGTGQVRRFESQSGRTSIAETITGEASYNWAVSGGDVTIDYSATTLASAALYCNGGNTLMKRGHAGLIQCAGNAGVTIDAQGATIASLYVFGGRCTLLNCGAVATVYLLGGTLDVSRAARPITLGGTLFIDGPGATYINSRLVTISNRAPIAGGAVGIS